MNEDGLGPERDVQSLQKLMLDVRRELTEIRRDRGQIAPGFDSIPYVPPQAREEHEQLLATFGRRVKILSERIAKRDLTYHASRDIRDPGVIANLMAPLANEERVSILSYLNQKPLSFKDLEEITGKRGGTLKHHLEQLEQAKYIQQVKSRGRYSITIDGQIAYRLSVWFASCLAPNDE